MLWPDSIFAPYKSEFKQRKSAIVYFCGEIGRQASRSGIIATNSKDHAAQRYAQLPVKNWGDPADSKLPGA
jgi:hypothetical protein